MNLLSKFVRFLVVTLALAACVFLVLVLVAKGLTRASAWAAVLAGVAGVVAACATVWPLIPRNRLPPPELQVPSWVVERPAMLAAVVSALLGARAQTVGITTALHGAGGFGKTTLALMVCCDRRVRRRFQGRIYLVTLGRDIQGPAAVAAKVNDLIKIVSGEDATFTDPEMAGRMLGALLDSGPRRLLVLDDVWESEHLAPFTNGGRRCARLVTTRVPRLLAGQGECVRVDQMSPRQAKALLTAELPPLDPALVGQLLAVTGLWPLLLRLVNKIFANAARAGADMQTTGSQLLTALQEGGPAVVDDLSRETNLVLKVAEPQERARAVRATIEASTSLLDPRDVDRFAELSIFAEDETIPFSLAAQLWLATGKLDDLQSSQLAARLHELALVSWAADENDELALHDVVRDFLRGELGSRRLAELSGALVDAVAASMAASAHPGPAGAWWGLKSSDRYMRDHLVEHLLEAGRRSDAEAVAGDLRWIGARLQAAGPATPASDLAMVDTSRSVRLQTSLARAAHLLAPTEPPESVIDVLHSRVADDPDWGEQARALRDQCHLPRLVNRSPLPDLPHPALRRVLPSRLHWVTAVTICPDGSWLAICSDDGTVRIWDAAMGQEHAVLTGSRGTVRTAAVALDSTWLASGGDDGSVRIWDAATGQVRRTLEDGHGRRGRVCAVAIAPDRSWLASGGDDGSVRIWDAATGQARRTLRTCHGRVRALAISPDGCWLATGGDEHGEVQLLDPATGRERATLAGHYAGVNAVVISPDGQWLATGSDDETVRIWDAASGQERVTLTSHHGRVNAVVISPNGQWLATGSDDGTVRIWDAANGQEKNCFPSGHGRVRAVAIAPDGEWLASGGEDGTIRIWNATAGPGRTPIRSHRGRVNAVAVSPVDGWLAAGGDDGTVRIYDATAGHEHSALAGLHGRVNVVAIAPGGGWLATGGEEDGTVRIWDTATGEQRACLTSHRRWVHAVAIAPDGGWLATGGEREAAPDGSWLATGDAVRIWDTATWQPRTALRGQPGKVTAVVIAPDSSWLATGGDEDGTVRIWDTPTWQPRTALRGHQGRVNAVAASPDGNWLATGGEDKTLRIWDAASGEVRSLMRTESVILACAWIGNSGLVLGGTVGLYLFDFLNGR